MAKPAMAIRHQDADARHPHPHPFGRCTQASEAAHGLLEGAAGRTALNAGRSEKNRENRVKNALTGRSWP
jgi:hypothetical protein